MGATATIDGVLRPIILRNINAKLTLDGRDESCIINSCEKAKLCLEIRLVTYENSSPRKRPMFSGPFRAGGRSDCSLMPPTRNDRQKSAAFLPVFFYF